MNGSWIDVATTVGSAVPVALGFTDIQSAPPVELQAAWHRQVVSAAMDHNDPSKYMTSIRASSSVYIFEGRVPTGSWEKPPECQVVEVGSNSVTSPYSGNTATITLAPASFRKALPRLTGPEAVVANGPISLIDDAAAFMVAIRDLPWQPAVWADDGEVVFEWIDDTRHAVVSIEGDGFIAYTLLRGDEFVSGELAEAPANSLPADLKAYLAAA